MSLARWIERESTVDAGSNVVHLVVAGPEWRELAKDIVAAGGRLLALWATRRSARIDVLQAVAIVVPRVLHVSVSAAGRRDAVSRHRGPVSGRSAHAACDS